MGQVVVKSHPKLREGHVFVHRFYPMALGKQKKDRRAAAGLAPSTQGKSPLPKWRRLYEKRRARALAAKRKAA